MKVIVELTEDTGRADQLGGNPALTQGRGEGDRLSLFSCTE